MVRQVEAALGHGNFMQGLLAAGVLELLVFRLNRLLVTAVVDIRELEEDQAKDGGAVLGGPEVGICAELIGRRPEVGFELFELIAGHVWITPTGCNSENYWQ